MEGYGIIWNVYGISNNWSKKRMKFSNTTDIPTRVILEAMLHSISTGVEIKEVVIRNKKEGGFIGNWGWYKPSEKKITLCVPRNVVGRSGRLPFTKHRACFESKTEFVVSVMAHELRHAWQFQVDTNKIHRWNSICELDAERYQIRMLEDWRAKHIPAPFRSESLFHLLAAQHIGG